MTRRIIMITYGSVMHLHCFGGEQTLERATGTSSSEKSNKSGLLASRNVDGGRELGRKERSSSSSTVLWCSEDSECKDLQFGAESGQHNFRNALPSSTWLGQAQSIERGTSKADLASLRSQSARWPPPHRVPSRLISLMSPEPGPRALTTAVWKSVHHNYASYRENVED